MIYKKYMEDTTDDEESDIKSSIYFEELEKTVSCKFKK